MDFDKGGIFADRYAIEALLGRGGMGQVYQAQDLALGERIALKLMGSEREVSPVQLLRFRQEVRLARRVTHVNVARVFDIGEHEGLVYLTMELIEGETLRARLSREQRLDLESAARIGREVCAGLAAAHAAGVVHRDLKPSNVMLGRDGRVVLSDFGIARSLRDAESLTFGAIGTPSYMAPEQLTGMPIDARTDVYAVGLLLREMLTGERPDRALTEVGAVAPRSVAELVRRCLALDPGERPASADEVARALSAASAAAPGPRPHEERPTAAADETARDRGAEAIARPLAPSDRALAVLPFRYRGPEAQAYFGEAVADELVDVLSRTRGVRVFGSGATARYKDSRDPRAVGADLGAGAIIDGAVQTAGDRVRITVRLVETANGLQRWSERYEGNLGDLLALQESIAQRVAEELRVGLSAITHRGAAPAEAVELYLAGRHRLRAYDTGDARAAVESMDRCLALAPDFGPALAARAVACLRAWFFDAEETALYWETAARESVERALARAPELPETHLAAGIRAMHLADYRAAACSMGHALAIAPTYADAHEYVGMLQCEAGRAAEGAKHLTLALALDPRLLYAGVFLARCHALAGCFEVAEAALLDLDLRLGPAVLPLTTAQRARNAGWRGDREGLRRGLAACAQNPSPHWAMIALYARALLGEVAPDELRGEIARLLTVSRNPRYLAVTSQIAAELYAALGHLDEARLHLERAAAGALVDLAWLERCPLLAPLRGLPDFAAARRRVRARAEAIWAT